MTIRFCTFPSEVDPKLLEAIRNDPQAGDKFDADLVRLALAGEPKQDVCVHCHAPRSSDAPRRLRFCPWRRS